MDNTDTFRADGIVPEDNIVDRYVLAADLAVLVDDLGTAHLANPREEPPRERYTALDSYAQEQLAEILTEITDE